MNRATACGFCGLLICTSLLAGQGIITTVAGTSAFFRGDGGPALSVQLGAVHGVAVDASGNLFVSDNTFHVVVKVSPAGILTVVAGNGFQGFSGDGGSATSARLNLPEGIALDRGGNLYIADSGNVRVRKVSPGGIITTVVGNGGFGATGDGGPATSATLSAFGLAIDSAGNMFIGDRDNNRVRRVDISGVITTVAGNGTRAFSGDGAAATSAALNAPQGVALDASGNLYIADYGNNRIRRVSPGGTITTFAGGGTGSFGSGTPATSIFLSLPVGVAAGPSGSVYLSEANSDVVRRVDSAGLQTIFAGRVLVRGYCCDGGPATSAMLSVPWAMALDNAGQLLISDSGNGRVRRVNVSGVIDTVAGAGTSFSGDGGPATAASVNEPASVVTLPSGELLIADTRNSRVRKVDATGIIRTIAGTGSLGFTGDGGPALNASFNLVSGLSVDSSGNIFVTDYGNKKIRRISPSGTISSVIGDGALSYCGAALPGNNVLSGIYNTAVDTAGNLYVADGWQHRVCKVSPGGAVTFIAGTGTAGFAGDGGPATSALLNFPASVSLDAAGNLFIADSGNHRVRKVSPTGTIATIAGNGTRGFGGDGGPATAAALSLPSGMTADGAGNLYIADTGNHRIRRVDASGAISTVAGNDCNVLTGNCTLGDGGPATSATLGSPSAVAVDSAGSLYIPGGNLGVCAGSFANCPNYLTGPPTRRVRKVLAAPPSFSASPTTASFTAVAGSAATASTLKATGSIPGLTFSTTARTADGKNWLSVSPASGSLPVSITVSADAAALAAGAYQGSIDISVPQAFPSAQTITVNFTVGAPQPPSLAVLPEVISLRVAAGSGTTAQTLQVANTGGSSLSWTAQAAAVSGNWLSVTPAAGTAAQGTPAILQVPVNPAQLAPGSYSGAVTVASATTNQTVRVPVSLQVLAPTGTLLLSQSNLLFHAVEAGGVEPPQTFGVLNVGSGAVDWTAGTTTPWLQLTSASGRSDAGSSQIPQVSVSINPSGLSAGFYIGLIQVVSSGANNSPQVARVDLQVLPRGTRLAAVVRPTGLIFVASADGAAPGSQEVRLGTSETSPIEFLGQAIGGDWVTFGPDSGSASTTQPAKVVIQPEIRGLTPGVYRAGLSLFTRNDGEIYPVRLLLLVLPAGGATAQAVSPAAACSPSQLLVQLTTVFSTFNATVGWPAPIGVAVRDNCGNPAVGGTVVVSFSTGEPPLVLADLKNGEFQGNWRPNSTAQVILTARASFQGLQAQASATAQVGVHPNAQASVLSQGGVALGAGFGRGPLAPGSIVSLFGQKLASAENFAGSLPLPSSLGGTRVLIGGQAVPLFYAGPGQVNAQIPAELSADRQLQVQVETNGIPSAPEPLQTSTNSPGIFTLGGTFGNQGAILIANTSLLAMPPTSGIPSQPADIGGFVSIYCTGLGPTDPTVQSGTGAPANPLATVKTLPSVTIGGRTANVAFGGLAPGFVGVYQINVQVPDGIATGNAVPVVITQGGAQSNTATIAVR